MSNTTRKTRTGLALMNVGENIGTHVPFGTTFIQTPLLVSQIFQAYLSLLAQ